MGKRRGDRKLALEDCRVSIRNQLKLLNKKYQYRFNFEEVEN